jgi:pimeloyl-ACP methyl ester carboxylesterase
MTHPDERSGSDTSYVNAVNRSINVGGTAFAYRDLGPRSGVPLIFLNHWGAVLDNFDPRIIDGLASRHRVIATDYRGIGASGGTAPVTVDEMARDAIALIHALGFEKVDLLGFSLGGFVRTDTQSLLAAVESHRGVGPTGAAGSRRHPDPGTDRQWRQRHHGAHREQHRYGTAHLGLAIGHLRRRRARRDLPAPRRFRSKGPVLPQGLTR